MDELDALPGTSWHRLGDLPDEGRVITAVVDGRSVALTRWARFHSPGDPRAGSWKEPPAPFPDCPEASLLGQELRAIAKRELDKLPQRQRIVVTLRDMLGFDSAEVCDLLDISTANQRVLLHRGRAAIRQALECYVCEGSSR